MVAGVYKLVAQARSTVTGTFNQFREVTVTVTANPVMWVDTPLPGSAVNHTFTLAGWAVDVAAASGTGVNTVHVWATPNPGSGAPAVFLGAAAYGGARSDIAAAYGSPFLNSGWSLTTTLSPGVYQLTAYAYSLVSGGFTLAQSVTVTVATSQPVIAIDAPAANATVGQPFGVAGWALDLGAPSSPGVIAVHVHAVAKWGQRGVHLPRGGDDRLSAAGRRGVLRAEQVHEQWLRPDGERAGAGYYQIRVYLLSEVSGQWTYTVVYVTVS